MTGEQMTEHWANHPPKAESEHIKQASWTDVGLGLETWYWVDEGYADIVLPGKETDVTKAWDMVWFRGWLRDMAVMHTGCDEAAIFVVSIGPRLHHPWLQVCVYDIWLPEGAAEQFMRQRSSASDTSP